MDILNGLLMDNDTLKQAFAELSTPLVADACLRVGLPLRLAPTGLRPLRPEYRLAGRVAPVQHFGSVDVFLEAIAGAAAGDVLVIDNQGRTDEGCIGDLTTLEAELAGLAGILVWGLHRDTAELLEINCPVFSYGRCPAGPLRLDARTPDALARARVGSLDVTKLDAVFADADGALFVPLAQTAEVLAVAQAIRQKERAQAEAIRAGRSLREQLRFADYLSQRAQNPAHTFREHLREIGGAIEE
jgi:regulator of RNase E activity RraA